MGKDGKWLNCRLRDIYEQLDEQAHGVSIPVISRLLKNHDYRLRVNVKERTSSILNEIASLSTFLTNEMSIKLPDSPF